MPSGQAEKSLATCLDPLSVNAKMSFSKVAYCLLIISVALTSGMPQNQATEPKEKSGLLPFLQFTNGGIRVNFGGYHAEAGLGGLLRGSGGGLHASVGTPWGAHAGAGLGGQLSGEDGSLGGGLYARAGLGHGRPEAAAGLGGSLDGSGRSANPISGGMYAGATPGGEGVGVFLGGGIGSRGVEMDYGPFSDGVYPIAREGSANAGASVGADATDGASSGADAAASGTKPSRGHTNIQIIRSKPKDAQKEKVALAVAALPADIPADEKSNKTKSAHDKEIRRAVVYAPPAPSAPLAPPLAEADLVKSIYLGTPPILKSVDKNVVVAAVPAAAAPAAVAVPVNASTNAVATVANNPKIISRPTHPRWYFRKRFWSAPRKVFYAAAPAAVDTQSASSDVVDRVFVNAAGNDGVVAVDKAYTSGSLFDDIFNIPISTLSAVNQLLKNNVG
ncbi:hypothetical protein DMN91_004375 [Ooceraea biroi]|uniref:Uncharacterized protein n=1 Tax=Ooceraea biroi TaxID=2015173 RepID=A0A3L8DUL7_OOCBI|nr:class E basic helix-loop-helix protein 22 [Ooceraea biroi]RLU24165.1 hypothetical protein DMN91_004375 [Ooceraea biroi]